MQVWQTILNIVVFLLCLSLVVCIHEAGHLTVAKICNVYCYEFSIGFGPLLFKHRFKHKIRKNRKGEETFKAEECSATTNKDSLTQGLIEGVESTTPTEEEPEEDKKKEKKLPEGYEWGETQLSIRAIPLGGYVSMAGEDGNVDDEGKSIPIERTITGVIHFKQICIMLAGIAMNFLLAIVLFVATYMVPQTRNILSSNAVVISENSVAADAGLKDGDQLIGIYQVYENLHMLDDHGQDVLVREAVEFPVKEDRETLTAYQKIKEGLSTAYTYDDLDHSSISYASQDIFTNYRFNKTSDDKPAFDLSAYDKKYNTGYSKYFAEGDSTRTFHITYLRDGKENCIVTKSITTKEAEMTVDNQKTTVFEFNYLGISAKRESFSYSFGEAYVLGHKQFGSLFVQLYTALGSIFTPSGWKNVGGIIAVYKMSAEGTRSGSAAYFLLLWGYISLNLGCFNLLPLPGLDGWQTLLALFETITRKKVSTKFKGIANTIGMIVLFIFAGILVVKDLISL